MSPARERDTTHNRSSNCATCLQRSHRHPCRVNALTLATGLFRGSIVQNDARCTIANTRARCRHNPAASIRVQSGRDLASRVALEGSTLKVREPTDAKARPIVGRLLSVPTAEPMQRVDEYKAVVPDPPA